MNNELKHKLTVLLDNTAPHWDTPAIRQGALNQLLALLEQSNLKARQSELRDVLSFGHPEEYIKQRLTTLRAQLDAHKGKQS